MTVKAQLNWTDGMQFIARAGKGPAVVSIAAKAAVAPVQWKWS
jgi:hypothetical protein